MSIDLSGLNPQQRKAAETLEGPVLILAGAGSGKTRTVTFRIANMILNHGIDPKSILAVSFTNKAATEMHERVKKLLGKHTRRRPNLSTFHTLGLKILREDIHHLGHSKEFTIYDASDQQAIVREALRKFTADKGAFDKKTILSKIGFLKNNGIEANEFAQSDFYDPENEYDEATEFVYHYYQDKLHFCNALDFDDILFSCVKLFRQNPELAHKYSERYRYLMVDEYQDTNGLQFEMVKALTSTHHNICVVGDDDQSIYAFRGADITNILNFEKLYPHTKVIKLEQNYRSRPCILDLANTVIKNNKFRKDKTMRSDRDRGHGPKLWSCANSDHEAQIVVDEIVRLQNEGVYLGEIALLYRSNTQIPPFEDQLRLAQIPYNVVGGQKFYEKKEIKDLIAYLSLIHNSKDELSLRRILNTPHRGIGTTTLKAFLEKSQQTQLGLFKTLQEFHHEMDKRRSEAIEGFIRLIKKYQKVFVQDNLLKAINLLIEEIHYMDLIEKSYDSPKIVARKKDDIKNFLLSTERFMDKFKQEANLANYLERLLLADNQDNRNGDGEHSQKNEVQLMTFHSSKGLEFENVFMVGMEEELLPHKNTIKGNEDIDEERRLCYVGMTRAKDHLIMTYSQERKIYGKNIKRHKSRFLLECENAFTEHDRNSFGHLSAEETESYKSNFFNDLLSSLD